MLGRSADYLYELARGAYNREGTFDLGSEVLNVLEEVSKVLLSA